MRRPLRQPVLEGPPGRRIRRTAQAHQPGLGGLLEDGLVGRGVAIGSGHGWALLACSPAGPARLALQASRARIICFSTALWESCMAWAISA